MNEDYYNVREKVLQLEHMSVLHEQAEDLYTASALLSEAKTGFFEGLKNFVSNLRSSLINLFNRFTSFITGVITGKTDNDKKLRKMVLKGSIVAVAVANLKTIKEGVHYVIKKSADELATKLGKYIEQKLGVQVSQFTAFINKFINKNQLDEAAIKQEYEKLIENFNKKEEKLQIYDEKYDKIRKVVDAKDLENTEKILATAKKYYADLSKGKKQIEQSLQQVDDFLKKYEHMAEKELPTEFNGTLLFKGVKNYGNGILKEFSTAMSQTSKLISDAERLDRIAKQAALDAERKAAASATDVGDSVPVSPQSSQSKSVNRSSELQRRKQQPQNFKDKVRSTGKKIAQGYGEAIKYVDKKRSHHPM
jgi:hypothetical protein